MFTEITQADYIGDYKVSVLFSDGVRKLVDFNDIVFGNYYPAFISLRDIERFKDFKVTDTLEWDEENIAIAPEKIYEIGEIEYSNKMSI